jgi:adenylosuccinate lyase
MSIDVYENPLVTRYASREMARIWSPERKIATWRRLWVALAEVQQELGLPIRNDQLRQLRDHVEDIDWGAVAKYERRLRHDVMAHVHAYGDASPDARGIIHWGATSCYVTDNTDLILLHDSLRLVRDRLVATIDRLGTFAAAHRDVSCLALTHLQPAQPTTVGKRACLWCYDLVLDLAEVEHRLATLAALGAQGTTGTQASFLKLFEGDQEKVRRLQERIAEKMGFERTYAVTGQTYPRKVDVQILDTLAGIAQSAHKAATDIRLLASRRELDEFFAEDQVGSSTMAYKRNPIMCERLCGLARYVMGLPSMAAATAATQWMERTLDDSSCRRLILPQAMLGVDAILILYENLARGLQVHQAVIAKHLREELPFLATENLLVAAVARGGDRQALHEIIRRHSQAAAMAIKERGAPNDLLERLAREPAFADLDLAQLLDVKELIGLAPQQVDEFIAGVVDPIRHRFPAALRAAPQVEV